MNFPSIDDFEFNSSIAVEHGSYKREPMKTIDVFYVFIDSNHSIHFIECEKENLVLLSLDTTINKGRGIQKDRLLQMIYNKKSVDGRKYKLFHMLQFHINIEHEHMFEFLKQDSVDYKHFVSSPSCLTDLEIEDSLDIFHSVNSLFVFLYENTPTNLRSKKTLRVYDDSNKRVTKKVRFV